MRTIEHFINGPAIRTAPRSGEVWNPSDGEVQADCRARHGGDARKGDGCGARRPAGLGGDQSAAAGAGEFAFKDLVERNMEQLAAMLSSEHGKVIADAKGDIQRGLEVIEFCCGIPHALKGDIPRARGPGSMSTRCASRSGSVPASPRSTSRR